MANAIVGDWEYCPDGVAPEVTPSKWQSKTLSGIASPAVATAIWSGKFGELHRKWSVNTTFSDLVFHYRTERREKKRLEMDPESPAVVEFVNANTEGQRLAFFDKYGLPEAIDGETLETVVSGMHKQMKGLLNDYSAGEVAHCVTSFEKFSADFSIRPDLKLRRGDEVVMTLRCNDLAGFMTMELAAIVAGNAQVLQCLHCNNIFTAGAGGVRKKKTAFYCSNKCRVAAQRAAAKGKQEKAGK